MLVFLLLHSSCGFRLPSPPSSCRILSSFSFVFLPPSFIFPLLVVFLLHSSFVVPPYSIFLRLSSSFSFVFRSSSLRIRPSFLSFFLPPSFFCLPFFLFLPSAVSLSPFFRFYLSSLSLRPPSSIFHVFLSHLVPSSLLWGCPLHVHC